jgi:hypothetical protein
MDPVFTQEQPEEALLCIFVATVFGEENLPAVKGSPPARASGTLPGFRGAGHGCDSNEKGAALGQSRAAPLLYRARYRDRITIKNTFLTIGPGRFELPTSSTPS